ncbi:hypothetical protein [Glaciecola sp. 1036]|uniref:hypothetical protein n=1 Tax=Alteromonadaceae TaxID=72275 RepID=UPI003CFCA534
MRLHHLILAAVIVVCSVQTKAEIITLNFEAVVVEGTFAGQSGFGSISYENTDVPLTGITFLGFSGSFFSDIEALTALSFNFLGQTYSGADDSDFPLLPLFSLSDSISNSLDFFVEDGIGTEILDERIINFQIFGDRFEGGLRDSNNGYDFEVDMFISERSSVPVQSPPILLLLLAGILILRRKNKF